MSRTPSRMKRPSASRVDRTARARMRLTSGAFVLESRRGPATLQDGLQPRQALLLSHDHEDVAHLQLRLRRRRDEDLAVAFDEQDVHAEPCAQVEVTEGAAGELLSDVQLFDEV